MRDLHDRAFLLSSLIFVLEISNFLNRFSSGLDFSSWDGPPIIIYFMEIFFCFIQLSTIWAETADNARSAARTYVLGGLSENHHGLFNFWVADKINVCLILSFIFPVQVPL